MGWTVRLTLCSINRLGTLPVHPQTVVGDGVFNRCCDSVVAMSPVREATT